MEGSQRWTREQIETAWDALTKYGGEYDRLSMYYDEGADSEFCEGHRRRLAEALTAAECVPAAEVERLREAFATLLEEARDMRSYVPEYFAAKWHHDVALSNAQAVLAALGGSQAKGSA